MNQTFNYGQTDAEYTETDLSAEYILPDAGDIIQTVHMTMLANFREDLGGTVELPSMWRLASLVVNQRAPLMIYSFASTEESEG